MIIKAKLNHLRIAPRKIRLLAKMIKGMEVNQAQAQLINNQKRTALPLLKLLKSAIANAHNNLNISKESKLVIANIKVDQGPTLKRWRPRAFGRASTIRKKTSHLTLELEAKKPKIVKKTTADKKKERAPKKEKVKEVKERKEPEKKSFFQRKKTLQKDSQVKKPKRRFFQRKAF